MAARVAWDAVPEPMVEYIDFDFYVALQDPPPVCYQKWNQCGDTTATVCLFFFPREVRGVKTAR
jgi:hypothetical protein